MKWLWIVPVFLVMGFLLAGCASTGMMEIPASALTSEDSRKVAYNVIGNASIAKEAVVHKSWQAYFKALPLMQEKVGFSMDYKQIKLSDGSTTFLPMVSYRPPIQIIAPPSKPSEHPVWGTINNFVNKVTPYAAGAFVADSMFGAFETMNENAGRKEYVTANGDGDINYVSQQSSVAIGDGNTETHVSEINNSDKATSNDEEEESEGYGRCRDNDSCAPGQICSRQDGSVGVCIDG